MDDLIDVPLPSIYFTNTNNLECSERRLVDNHIKAVVDDNNAFRSSVEIKQHLIIIAFFEIFQQYNKNVKYFKCRSLDSINRI